MRRVRRQSTEPRLELTPLLDMMFLLLTFFIFAFALIVRLKITDIRLPETSAGKTVQRAPAIVVALSGSGELSLDGQPVSRESLADAIRARREAAPESILFIATDETSSSGDLFRLIDTLQQAGFQDLRFLRTPSESGAETTIPPPDSAP